MATTADSAYVSVSNALQRAIAFANSYAGASDIWVYEIRAVDHFYSAMETTLNGLAHQDRAVRRRAYDLLNDRAGAMEAEGEYVALNGISETLVRTATRYTWQGNRYVATNDRRTNDLYLDGNTHANEGPLDAGTAFRSSIGLGGRFVTIGSSMYGACSCMSKQGEAMHGLLSASTEADTDYSAYCKPMLRDKYATSVMNIHLFD